MRQFEHDMVLCQSCGRELEASVQVDGDEHESIDGGFCVCAYCSDISVFVVAGGKVSLRDPTLRELEYFDAHFREYIKALNESRSWRSES